jgi:formiminotetrahydrofolate cyclodeaminase
MNPTTLLKKQEKAYKTIDEVLESLYKGANTEKRIKIRALQRAINTAISCEYELSKFDNQ